jgi:uncharacterized repeat protein (TIGR03803 family)
MIVAKSLISHLLILASLGFAAKIASAQSDEATAASVQFTTLHSFDATDGNSPQAGLVQATNGDLYGTTYGVLVPHSSFGTVFKITPSGALTTLYGFCAQSGCADGAYPHATLVQATNGDLYGTTLQGGVGASCSNAPGCGTVFKMTPTGTLTTLYNFCTQTACADGGQPSGLVQAANGDLYGTTYIGGSYGSGIVFKITPSGTLTTLHSFDTTDGANPVAGLVQAVDGNLYGTTLFGGNGTGGTVFKMTPAGTLTTLYSFCSQTGCPNGRQPFAGLVQASNGEFYGTTSGGAAKDNGTVFKITTNGALTTLYVFCTQSQCTDGGGPEATLVQAANGDLYGTTNGGGARLQGTLFKITQSGALTTLYSFCALQKCADGGESYGGLAHDTNGQFYGTTSEGGDPNGCTRAPCYGTVFSLSTGQSPFIETRPGAGKVGEAVTILGNSLTDATSVTFDGTAAAFTVVSAREITTTVPSGATSGKIQVTTPTGTLTSNIAFEIP